MADLFQNTSAKASDYSAKDIEVLEGLEPVRKRPGMYIGGTDERALHHLVAEVLDNAMDEAVAGHATRIELELAADGSATVRDNGRGIPTDPHPKFKGKPALEVILTTLHSGAKFSDKAYETSGGLNGVGISVVNALSERLTIEVARERQLWRQDYARGKPTGKLKTVGQAQNRRGTSITFWPDPEIFGDRTLQPKTLFRMARSKAYLYKGVEIRWRCAPELIRPNDQLPYSEVLHFPNGLRDFLEASMKGDRTLTPDPFVSEAQLPDGAGRVEWAVTWPVSEEGFVHSYCNTVPTPLGGTHESGLRSGMLRSLKAYGDMVGNRRAAKITAEDVLGGAAALLSIFIKAPQFQGQTKEKLTSVEAARLTDAVVKDHFDHWLSGHPERAGLLLERIVSRAEERMRRKQERETNRKSATRKLRLPGKLSDCARNKADGTEIFLVEGDSAGGTAKQARSRDTQAILPLRGKVLNVASASADKIKANQELSDLILALGCGSGTSFDPEKLRYERVIIMTDADVDGAHIASLLLTFFFREMPGLIEAGRIYLAQPPLYRLVQGSKSVYARDEAHRDELLRDHFKGKGKVDISRFKGLGEMSPPQLKQTTMDPGVRTLLRVMIVNPESETPNTEIKETADRVEQLMGRKPELRFAFIQEHARFVEEIDV